MHYPPPYIRSLPHSQFYCHFVFSVKSDCMCVMGARPSLLFCSLLLCKYRSKCIVSSDWSIHDDRMFSSSRPITHIVFSTKHKFWVRKETSHTKNLCYYRQLLKYVLFRECSGSVIECVLSSRPMGRWFEPHGGHCVVVLEQDTFILA